MSVIAGRLSFTEETQKLYTVRCGLPFIFRDSFYISLRENKALNWCLVNKPSFKKSAHALECSGKQTSVCFGQVEQPAA